MRFFVLFLDSIIILIGNPRGSKVWDVLIARERVCMATLVGIKRGDISKFNYRSGRPRDSNRLVMVMGYQSQPIIERRELKSKQPKRSDSKVTGETMPGRYKHISSMIRGVVLGQIDGCVPWLTWLMILGRNYCGKFSTP